jgi:hypothetical protein
MPPKLASAMAAVKAKLAATAALKAGATPSEDGAAKAKPIPSYLRPTARGKNEPVVKHQYKVRHRTLRVRPMRD